MQSELHLWCDYAGVEPCDVAAVIDALLRIDVWCAGTRAGCRGPSLLFADGHGSEVLNRVRKRSRDGGGRLVVVTRNGASQGAGWALLNAGATDVVRLSDPAATADAIAARFRRWAAVDDILDSPLVRSRLVGESEVWRTFLGRIIDVAHFSRMPVLIQGESGTGKELVASLVNALDPRGSAKRLVTVDCTTIVPELSGSEFFGHERGAFTGAVAARDGAFALADGGTLFLDEVAELPPRLQAALLRVIQEGTYKRVGANVWQKTTFRLVCATHRDLGVEVDAGRFRSDLYYRISAWRGQVPSLRERRQDIPALVRHFLALQGKGDVAIDDDVLDFLKSRDYPGNVRDLRNTVERIAHRHAGGGPITLGTVPEEERPAVRAATDYSLDEAVRRALLGGMGLKDISNAAAEAAVRLALDFECGHVGRAAARLRVTERGLQKRRKRGYSGASPLASPG